MTTKPNDFGFGNISAILFHVQNSVKENYPVSAIFRIKFFPICVSLLRSIASGWKLPTEIKILDVVNEVMLTTGRAGVNTKRPIFILARRGYFFIFAAQPEFWLILFKRECYNSTGNSSDESVNNRTKNRSSIFNSCGS